MRKQVFGRKFKRDANERKALFNSLISAMILRGEIKTTEQKAKAIKSDLEKLVTKAKKGESAKRLLQPRLKPFEIELMINKIGPGFKNRAGGYTRIIRAGRRFNDDASMVIMQWSEMEAVTAPVKTAAPKKAPVKTKPVKKTAAKKAAAKKPAKKGTK
jgi:large subunit ribosomal protein L17